MFKSLPQIAILVGLLLGTAHAEANNNFFLPGDAFFPTSLSQAELQDLAKKDEKSRLYRYDEMGAWDVAFCGNAGFTRARVAGVNERFLENLTKAYKKLREEENRKFVEIVVDGKTTLHETNPMRVLFYASAYDHEKFGLGLQYNEDWPEQLKAFGHDEHTRHRLCSFVDRKEAIEQGWLWSKTVPALKAEFPKFESNPSLTIVEPMTITEPVRAIVLRGDKSCTDYYDKKALDFLELFIVDANGIDDVRWDGEKWARRNE